MTNATVKGPLTLPDDSTQIMRTGYLIPKDLVITLYADMLRCYLVLHVDAINHSRCGIRYLIDGEIKYTHVYTIQPLTFLLEERVLAVYRDGKLLVENL